MFPSEHYLQSSWVFLVLGTRDGALQEVTWSKQRGGTGTISSDVQFIYSYDQKRKSVETHNILCEIDHAYRILSCLSYPINTRARLLPLHFILGVQATVLSSLVPKLSTLEWEN